MDGSRSRGTAERALVGVVREYGIDLVHVFPGVLGSWWREIIAHMRESGTQSQQLSKLERALDKTPRAVLQIGSVLLVKVDDTVVVRNLTQRELAFYERNPALFRDPVNAMLHLRRAASGELDLDSEVADEPRTRSVG
jgi:hypothetical protein